MDAHLFEGEPAGSTLTKSVVLADGKPYPFEFQRVDSDTWTRYRVRLVTANEQEDPDSRGRLLLDAQAFIVAASVVGVNGKTDTITAETARRFHSTVMDRFIGAINEVHALPKIAEAGKG